MVYRSSGLILGAIMFLISASLLFTGISVSEAGQVSRGRGFV